MFGEWSEYDDENRDVETVKGSWLFRVPGTGQLADVGVIVATPEEWARRPESRAEGWHAQVFGSSLVAVRLLF